MLTKFRFPEYSVNQLPCAPFRGHFIVNLPLPVPGWPEYLCGRIDNIVGQKALSIILTAFKRYIQTNPRVQGERVREEIRCNPESQVFYHVGAWSKKCARMMLTGDTRNQSEETKAALKDLLGELQEHAIPNMSAELRKRIPTHFYNTDQYVPLSLACEAASNLFV